MAEQQKRCITKIRTAVGDLPIDYNALENKPDLSLSGLGITPESIKAAPANHTHSLDDLGVAAAEHTHTFFSIGISPPSDTKVLWIDTNVDTGGLKYYDGKEWACVPVSYT